jgi:hypothetical protein
VADKAKRKKQTEELERAQRAKSKPAPEVKDGLTERAEALSINLTLSEAERNELEKWIFDRMNEGFGSSERREAIERIQLARERYEHGVARDDMPFDNAHDVRLRWGAGQADNFAVRLSEGLFGQDPVIRVSPRNARSVDKAPIVEKFLDWWHDEYWHLGDRGPDIVDNVTREGHRVLHLPYRLEIVKGALQQVEKRRYADPVTGKGRWVDIDSMEEMVTAIEDGLRPTSEYKIFDEKRDKLVMNGPDLEDLSLEDYVYPPWATPENEGDLPYEGVRQWHMLSTLEEMDREKELYPGTLEKVRTDLVTPPTGKKNGGDAHSGEAARLTDEDAMVECWIWYGLAPLPNEKGLSRIMALVHPKTSTVLWARPRREEHWESPVTHARFLEMSWRFAGVSALELFDSIEQAAQNLINYALDETYVLASTSFTYRENRFDPEDHPLKPWRGIPVRSHADISWVNRNDRRPMDLNLLQLLLGFGEQRVNIGPYQQGQESGKNPRPTARGIFMLLDQASKLFNRAVRGQLKAWKAVARKELALFQQTMPEYMAVDAVGSDGRALFPTGMGRRHISGKFSFDMSGNVENVLYELDRELTLGIYDLMKDNPLVKTSLTAFYNLTEDVWRSFKRKRKLLPELEVLQKKLGLQPTPPPLSPQAERELIAELKARKLTEDEIQAVLKKVQSIPVDEPIVSPEGPGVPPGAGPVSSDGLPPPDFPSELLEEDAAPEGTGL